MGGPGLGPRGHPGAEGHFRRRKRDAKPWQCGTFRCVWELEASPSDAAAGTYGRGEARKGSREAAGGATLGALLSR